MSAVTPLDARHKLGLRASDYLMLSDAGAFDGYGRTELIEGEIWTMNAVHSWHARTTFDLGIEIDSALRSAGSDLRIFAAGSLQLDGNSVPEPDIAVAEDHDEGVLPLEKLKLAIEISDSTQAIDLGVKMRLYARAGVPEYWVVDRESRTIHQMWQPEGEDFARQRTIPFGDVVTAATLDAIAVPTGRLD